MPQSAVKVTPLPPLADSNGTGRRENKKVEPVCVPNLELSARSEGSGKKSKRKKHFKMFGKKKRDGNSELNDGCVNSDNRTDRSVDSERLDTSSQTAVTNSPDQCSPRDQLAISKKKLSLPSVFKPQDVIATLIRLGSSRLKLSSDKTKRDKSDEEKKHKKNKLKSKSERLSPTEFKERIQRRANELQLLSSSEKPKTQKNKRAEGLSTTEPRITPRLEKTAEVTTTMISRNETEQPKLPAVGPLPPPRKIRLKGKLIPPLPVCETYYVTAMFKAANTDLDSISADILNEYRSWANSGLFILCAELCWSTPKSFKSQTRCVCRLTDELHRIVTESKLAFCSLVGHRTFPETTGENVYTPGNCENLLGLHRYYSFELLSRYTHVDAGRMHRKTWKFRPTHPSWDDVTTSIDSDKLQSYTVAHLNLICIKHQSLQPPIPAVIQTNIPCDQKYINLTSCHGNRREVEVSTQSIGDEPDRVKTTKNGYQSADSKLLQQFENLHHISSNNWALQSEINRNNDESNLKSILQVEPYLEIDKLLQIETTLGSKYGLENDTTREDEYFESAETQLWQQRQQPQQLTPNYSDISSESNCRTTTTTKVLYHRRKHRSATTTDDGFGSMGSTISSQRCVDSEDEMKRSFGSCDDKLMVAEEQPDEQLETVDFSFRTLSNQQVDEETIEQTPSKDGDTFVQNSTIFSSDEIVFSPTFDSSLPLPSTVEHRGATESNVIERKSQFVFGKCSPNSFELKSYLPANQLQLTQLSNSKVHPMEMGVSKPSSFRSLVVMPSLKLSPIGQFSKPIETKFITSIYELSNTYSNRAEAETQLLDELKRWSTERFLVCCEMIWSTPETMKNPLLEHDMREIVRRKLVESKYQLCEKLGFDSMPGSQCHESTKQHRSYGSIWTGAFRYYTTALLALAHNDTREQHADYWQFTPWITPWAPLIADNSVEHLQQHSIVKLNFVTLKFAD